MGTPAAPPLPTDSDEFENDDRISFSRLDAKFIGVLDDGSEFEFDERTNRWIAIDDAADADVDELANYASEQQEQHRQLPSRPHDENTKKRKNGPSADYEQGNNGSGSASGSNNVNRDPGSRIGSSDVAGNSTHNPKPRPAKKQKPAPPPKQNAAVYVTGLPLDATVDEVHELFSRKGGLIQEQIDGGGPRIKLYTDEAGNFKGDGLVVFFKPQSVQMAVMLLDDTDFRFTPSGTSAGRMRVQPADDSYRKDPPALAQGGSSRAADGETPRPPPRRNDQDRQKIIKKTQKLESKLADWSDDEDHPAAAALGIVPAPSAAGSKWEKLVILRHMFTLEELAEDPAALLEIKEDVRDECAKLGPVTNVVLYDLEPEGVISVRFRTTEGAAACIQRMQGRNFDGRVVEAHIATSKPRFRKSRDEAADEDED